MLELIILVGMTLLFFFGFLFVGMLTGGFVGNLLIPIFVAIYRPFSAERKFQRLQEDEFHFTRLKPGKQDPYVKTDEEGYIIDPRVFARREEVIKCGGPNITEGFWY
jgi:hypothetical protein